MEEDISDLSKAREVTSSRHRRDNPAPAEAATVVSWEMTEYPNARGERRDWRPGGQQLPESRQALPIRALLAQILSQSLLAKKSLLLIPVLQSRRPNCHSCGLSGGECYCRNGDSSIPSAIPSIFSHPHRSYAPLSDSPRILRGALCPKRHFCNSGPLLPSQQPFSISCHNFSEATSELQHTGIFWL